jgi:two-component system nitrate/nitrite sensor histidine kinase NarX
MEQDEFGALGNAFESMRREVASAQDELEERVDRRTRELAAAFELSQEIVAQLDLDHLLRSVTQRAQALTNAWASSLCLLEGEERELVLVSNSGDDPAPLNLRQPLQRDPANRVVNTNETVALEAGRTQCAYLQARAPGQCAVAPLRAGDATLGALCVVRQAGAPVDADEQRALTLLANAAAVAISNARLAEAGKRHAEQAAVLSERERLAGELHDNLAQTLSFLNFQVEQMEKLVAGEKAEEAIPVLERMKSAIHGAYEQVRLALTGLSEPQPASGDFEQRLRGSLEEYRQSTGLRVELEVADPSALELPRLAQAQVILILREALANVHKHAEAGEVHVRVERLDGQSRFIVEDDGRGFDPHTAQGGHHLGLRLMQARAERSGGTLEVESAPGEGTRVVVGFPNGAGEP